MNDCENIIKGICSGDELAKMQVFNNYFAVVEDFVEKNNTVNNTTISSKYIFFDCLGLINMKYTGGYKRNILGKKKIVTLAFEHILYYLSKELYICELEVIRSEKKRFFIKKKYEYIDTITLTNQKLLEQEFRENIDIRAGELSLLRDIVSGNNMDEFTKKYFDLALDIINKSKNAIDKLNNHEVEEYAKDIFSEATLKLFTLVIEGNYVYEAKISSFIYWPMFNKWTKISKDIGVSFDNGVMESLPDEEKLYFDNNLEEEELKLFIKDNFAKLSEREREILWMKEIEGYSYQEIKEKLNLDEEVNYLKQIKLRGKRNLEEKIKKDRRFFEFLN